jgi:hypothetical protein
MAHDRLAAMKARLKQIEHQRGLLLIEIEDRKRAVADMDRDARVIALAIDEATKPKKEPEKPGDPAKVK